MVDFHTHILPGIDDGSRSVEMSLEMLDRMKQNGIDKVAATPHFYADSMQPDRFFQKRSDAYAALQEQLPEDAPAIQLGAEVHYYDGVGNMERIRDFRIGTTGVLLLEMPAVPWSGRVMENLRKLTSIPDLILMIAHTERCLPAQSRQTLREFYSMPVILQSNAEIFLDWKTKRMSVRQFKKGAIHLLASDCHNLENRSPNLSEGLAILESSCGNSARAQMERFADQLWSGEMLKA